MHSVTYCTCFQGHIHFQNGLRSLRYMCKCNLVNALKDKCGLPGATIYETRKSLAAKLQIFCPQFFG